MVERNLVIFHLKSNMLLCVMKYHCHEQHVFHVNILADIIIELL